MLTITIRQHGKIIGRVLAEDDFDKFAQSDLIGKPMRLWQEAAIRSCYQLTHNWRKTAQILQIPERTLYHLKKRLKI